MAAPKLDVVARLASRLRPDGDTAADDFYCLRYQVRYSSYDCALRTRFQTCPGCLRCEQGRFNLKRHQPAIRRALLSLPGVD